jgi:uncharacterized protein
VHQARDHKLIRHRLASTLITAITIMVEMSSCRQKPEETPSSPVDDEQANAAVEEWRAKHEADYRRDYVTVAGLHILQQGSNAAGSAATNQIVLPSSVPATLGRFVLEGTQVRFEPASGVDVRLRGEPVRTPVQLLDDRDPDSDELTIGDVRLVVHVSGETRSIRVRDPNGPLARGFVGFTWFPIDSTYRATGRLVKDPAPQRFKVPNTYGDEDEYVSDGVVEFVLHGHTLRLRPFTTRPKRFYFVFRDASNGQGTYETARFLYSDLQDDGRTMLDFNMAYNPPCAFNPYTTCPIPLRENRLPVKVLAGEKAYPIKLALPKKTAR